MKNKVWRVVGIDYNLGHVPIEKGENYVHLLASLTSTDIALKLEEVKGRHSLWTNTISSGNVFVGDYWCLHMNGDGGHPETGDPFLTLTFYNSHAEANAGGIEAMKYLENDKGFIVGSCEEGLAFWYGQYWGEGWRLKKGSVSEFIHDAEDANPEDEEIVNENWKNYPISKWETDVKIWADISHGAGIIRRNLTSGDYQGTEEELLAAARPIILSKFKEFIGLIRENTDAIDWMLRRAESFDGLGVTKEELVASCEPIIYDHWCNFTHQLLREYYVHAELAIKALGKIEKAGYDRIKFITPLQELIINNTRQYVGLFISNSSGLEMINKKVESLLPLIVDPTSFIAEIGAAIIKKYNELPEATQSMLRRKGINKWIAYSIKGGLPADYLSLINNSPDLELDSDLLQRANKLTKAYKILKRNTAVMERIKTFAIWENEGRDSRDLEYARQWASKWGYEVDENPDIDQVIKNLAIRHNTFLRAQKNVAHLESHCTTVPPPDKADIQLTGVEELTHNGKLGLIFCTNKMDDAMGYGTIGIVRRPLDFSGDRSTWLDNNDFSVVEFDPENAEESYKAFLEANKQTHLIFKSPQDYGGIVHYIFRGHFGEKLLEWVGKAEGDGVEGMLSKR